MKVERKMREVFYTYGEVSKTRIPLNSHYHHVQSNPSFKCFEKTILSYQPTTPYVISKHERKIVSIKPILYCL